MNDQSRRDKDQNINEQDREHARRDPITGAPGSQPSNPGKSAATVGGAAGVAAAGAAIGGAGAGPVGAAVGAVAGAVAGGVGGRAAAEYMDPTEEDAYWRQHHAEQTWGGSGSRYDDYAGAYRTGYEGYAKNCASGRSFDECEPELRQDYERNYPGKLTWDQARHASRAAWDRFDRHLDRYIDFDVVDRDREKIGTLQCLWSDHRGEPAFIGVKTGWLFGKTHVVPAQGVQVNEQERHLRLPYSVQKVKDAPAYDEECQMTQDMERDVYRYYGVQETGMQASTESATGTRERLPHTGQPTPEQATIQLSEEQLKVGKREVEAGGVRLRKVVRTRMVNQPVEVKQEEIVVERVPASEAHTAQQQAFNEQEVYIPLRREEVVIQKEARLKEEVRARKQVHTEQQQISEEVRSEDVEIEEKGEARKGSPRNTRGGGGSTPAEEIRKREEAPRSMRRGDE